MTASATTDAGPEDEQASASEIEEPRRQALDLRLALNAVSDIVENRPRPIREFDQIYMKVGDMMVHAEYICRKTHGRSLVFVGDGDAIGLCIAHLQAQKILNWGPSRILLLDFDERMVNSVNRFAEANDLTDRISATLYNVLDALPDDLLGQFGAFHINPPWGQYNDGESVVVFMERGIQLLAPKGKGVIVIGDDPARPWTRQVLARTQGEALNRGMVVCEMQPRMHLYHLDDASDLTSCALSIEAWTDHNIKNEPTPAERRKNFYGRKDRAVVVRYVRETPQIGRGTADPTEYHFEIMEEEVENEQSA
ncbi:bis-aminopropyl spermidine synthase family protein [Microvirga mediterraneensis]|uniref:Bis-aminopropyl spermidine synthase family protein n=1 Tax=Microvirga mediterraneensis TaxID=2754695 RepID=A0A838BU32_9HYPH|nr:bis-aminopropyl spermidine synthase family protein [Microvirga mediterraneensis]MBA1158921.1 bis-aminopropyl spermidine synthase family protein [Microvirga mediterraneensis]